MAKNEFELKVQNNNNFRKNITFPITNGVVATVNGVVRVRMFVRCSVDFVGAGNLTIRSGALTDIVTVNVADLTAGKLILKNGVVKNAAKYEDVIFDFITSKDVVIENFETITAGKLIFNIWSEPLNLLGELLV